MFSSFVEDWLNKCLDMELSEEQFWNMSIAELQRYAQSFNRRTMEKAREKAEYDYILAQLIGANVAKLLSNSAKCPNICEVYPSLFKDEQEKMEKQKEQLSIERFKQFASSFNNKFKKEEPIKNE